MRRWGLALGAFTLLVIVFLGWRAWRADAVPAPPAIDAGVASTAPTGTPQPRVARPQNAGDPATVTGHVRDAATRPIAGARVCVDLECSTTDATGAFALSRVPLSASSIRASAPKFREDIVALPPLAPGEARAGVDIVLRAGVRVRGRVIEVGGTPIAGASVLAATTGADGRFELWAAPGHLVLHASADGYGSARPYVVAPADDVEIVLHAASSITGIVVDDATSEPVGGARVHAGAEPVVADDEGRFQLDGLRRGRYVVEANTPQSAGRTFEIHVGLAEHVDGIVVRMRPAHQLSIRLRRPDGSVCTDPHIELDTWGTDAGARWRDGELIRFDGVPPDRYVLTSSCGGKDRTVHPPIDVRADTLFEITGKRRATGRLFGTITASGRDSEAIQVWAASPRRSHTATADPDGRYELTLDAGTYKVRAGGEDPETPEVTLEIVDGQETEYNAQLSSTTTGHLIVRVVDGEGTALAGVPVVAMRTGTVNEHSSQSTDRAGVVRARLEPGSYRVYVSDFRASAGSESVTAEVVAGTERTVRLVLYDAGWKVRGVVVDPDGAPVASAVVSVTVFGSYGALTDHATSAADGTFELSRRYRRGAEVSAQRPGGGTSPEVRIESDAPVRLVLEVPASVSGAVAMADGSTPKRFDIIVKSGNDRVTRTFLHSGGTFVIANVPPGKIKLGAAINGIEVWTELTLMAGQRLTGVAMTLPAVAAISGRVVDAGTRTPVEGVKLNLMCTPGDDLLAFNHADQRTDADGRFEIRELPPGSCVVEVRPPSSVWLPSNHTITVPERGTGDVGELAIARAR